LDGQEEKLEDYYKFMHPREAETFLLLRKEKVLRDVDQDPAIRVALRSIRDFAVGFKVGDEIYWKYIMVEDDEVERLINGKEKKEDVKEDRKEVGLKEKKVKNDNEFKNPSIQPEKPKKKKVKSDFVLKVFSLLFSETLSYFNSESSGASFTSPSFSILFSSLFSSTILDHYHHFLLVFFFLVI